MLMPLLPHQLPPLQQPLPVPQQALQLVHPRARLPVHLLPPPPQRVLVHPPTPMRMQRPPPLTGGNNQGNPCSNHIGPDCPDTYVCTQYNLCVGGSVIKAAKTTVAKPKFEDLMLFGRPCNNDGISVCCRKPGLPVEPVEAESDRTDPVVVPPPPPSVVPIPPPPVTAAPLPPPPSPPRQVPVPAPVPAPAPVPTQPPRPAPVPTQTQRPLPPPPPAQDIPRIPEGPAVDGLPYPGCAAALKCVLNEFCSIEGIMVNTPVSQATLNSLFRVPLSKCLNPETNEVGVCCRDPLYEDPWPADMPMPPGLPPKVMIVNPTPVAPVLPPSPALPTQPPVLPPSPPAPPKNEPVIEESPSEQSDVVLCSTTQECVSRDICSKRIGQTTISSKMCRQNTGILGVCCSSEPPRIDTPNLAYLPPPPPPALDQTYIPPSGHLQPPSSGYGKR